MARRVLLALVVTLSPGTSGAAFAQISKIPANPQKGFQWPYYLYIPATITRPTILLVEPNNTGTVNDDVSVHDQAAFDELNKWRLRGDILGSPYLIPTFPRPETNWQVYTQALDRDTLLTNLPGLVRIDLQLIAMIDDARGLLAGKGIDVGPKVWMIGFSASGGFVNRFSVLHPDRVQAVSAGAGSAPIAPVSTWKGKTLRYPVGVADLQQLTGQAFDQATFSKVPMQIYVGDQDVNEAVYPGDGFDAEDVAVINSVFGGPLFLRTPSFEAAYNSIGSSSQFVIFPGLKHDWADWSFIREFLERNRTAPFPAPLPKPMWYQLYFPHVTSYGQWETEIAVSNTSEVPVNGQWLAFDASGGQLGQPIPIVLPPIGRKQIIVGSYFSNPQDIAYVTLVSDSGFLAGYTRFSQPGNRASLAAGTGTKLGWFAKVEKDGWTGIAFVNTEATDATVNLSAWDANGNVVATRTLPLTPGQKYVGLVGELFSGDLTHAVYFKFKSDKNVVGFTVNGSGDGQMLDGLHCLDQYIFIK